MAKTKVEINPGDIYGRYTIIKEVGKNKRGEILVLCECSCPDKTRKVVVFYRLMIGTTKSCGCKKRDFAINMHGEVKIGEKFNKLTILEEAGRNKHGSRMVLCECDCINKTQKILNYRYVRIGHTKSCGCSFIESHKNRRKDWIGKKIGRLTIVGEIKGLKQRRVIATCECDGNIETKEYSLGSLTRNRKRVNSCGCLSTEQKTNQVKDYQEKHQLFCKVEEIRDIKDGVGIEVKCKNGNCDKWFKPTQNQIYSRLAALENPASLGTECNFYCSDDCKHSCILYYLRSDPNTKSEANLNAPTGYELAIWREENLQRQRDVYGYNFCTINENHLSDDLIAHHIDPKKLEPGLALDPENCIIVCRECHDELHKGGCSTGKLANVVCTY